LRELEDVREIPDVSLARSRGGSSFHVKRPVIAKPRHRQNDPKDWNVLRIYIQIF